MIFQLHPVNPYFPDPLTIDIDKREKNGLFAVGGDLSAERLLRAYSMGAFPWTAFRDLEVLEGEEPEWWNQLHWYCPTERFVIFPDEIHISHSMRTQLNKEAYRLSIDEDFEGVINACAEGRIEQDGAWLGPQMIAAYTKMHRLGFGHSVEVWKEDQLAGGLYGLAFDGAFFGESMFSRVPGGSKFALIHLARTMQERGGKFIDCQFETPHLRSMGGRIIRYAEYRQLLATPPLRDIFNM